jgi:hypothetical protein
MGAAGSTQVPAKYTPTTTASSISESESKGTANNSPRKYVESSNKEDKGIIPNKSTKLTRNGDGAPIDNSQPKDETVSKPANKPRRKSFEDNMKDFNMNTNCDYTDTEAKLDAKCIIVNDFMKQQVENVSHKVVSRQFQMAPSQSYNALDTGKDEGDSHSHPKTHGFLSKSLKTGNKLPSTNSSLTLRGMAKRHHARQHNAYMNANSLVQVSSFLNSFSSKPAPHDSGESLMSKKSSGSKGSMKLDKIEEKVKVKENSNTAITSDKKGGLSGIALPPPLKLEVVPAAAPPANNMKKKFGLNLKIQVNDDEDDWIQVGSCCAYMLLCCALLCSTVYFTTILHLTLLCCTVLFSSVLYCTVLYCSELCSQLLVNCSL